jgi:hypothetical protein
MRFIVVLNPSMSRDFQLILVSFYIVATSTPVTTESCISLFWRNVFKIPPISALPNGPGHY